MQLHPIASIKAANLGEMVSGAFSSVDRDQISHQVWLVASKRPGRNLDLYDRQYTVAEGQTPDGPVIGTITVPVTNCYGFANAAS